MVRGWLNGLRRDRALIRGIIALLVMPMLLATVPRAPTAATDIDRMVAAAFCGPTAPDTDSSGTGTNPHEHHCVLCAATGAAGSAAIIGLVWPLTAAPAASPGAGDGPDIPPPAHRKLGDSPPRGPPSSLV